MNPESSNGSEVVSGDLHPWGIVFGLLLDLSSDDVVKFVTRAGLQVDWQVTGHPDYSQSTRKRAYVPRIQTAYNALTDDQKLTVAGILANDLSASHPDKVKELNDRLAQIGWRIESGHLSPSRLDVVELFFPAESQHDAYVEIRSLLRQAKKCIVFVDPYIDSTVFHLLSTVQETLIVRILSHKLSSDFAAEARRFLIQHKQFSLKVKLTSDFHDRFIIVDETLCYHIGASVKDAGNKAFMISRIQDSANRGALVSQLEQSWRFGTDLSL
jgi:hypothetical protein